MTEITCFYSPQLTVSDRLTIQKLLSLHFDERQDRERAGSGEDGRVQDEGKYSLEMAV